MLTLLYILNKIKIYYRNEDKKIKKKSIRFTKVGIF